MEQQNSRMSLQWHKAMCREMGIPEGYQYISVLILKWIDELDQLKSQMEVSNPQQHRTMARTDVLHTR